jgi:hypothetical protein
MVMKTFKQAFQEAGYQYGEDAIKWTEPEGWRVTAWSTTTAMEVLPPNAAVVRQR